MPRRRDHAMRHLLSAFADQLWAIEESKLAAIRELIELRAAGLEYTPAELAARFGEGRPSADEELPYTIQNGVAVLQLYGTLAPRMNLLMRYSGGTSTQLFGQWFEQALDDTNVKSIVLDVDSPGGTAAGSAELSDQLYAARGKKPIVAVATDMMASAAYYIASAAGKVVASPSASVGSIGVLTVQVERSGAEAKAGVKTTVFRAGTFKADGNPYEPLTAQSRATIQERIDDCYAQFVATVARNRGISVATVERDFGQGKCFLAPKALENGLVDRIATLSDVVAEMAKANDTSTTFHVGRGPLTASADPPAPPSSTPSPVTKELPVNPRIKAALAALGICAFDATDDVAKVALAAYFAATGAAAPEGDEKILNALLNRGEAKPAAKTEVVAGVQIFEPVALNSSERATAAKDERDRIAEIQARGKLLKVSDELIQKAVDDGIGLGKALKLFTAEMAKEGVPVQSASDVTIVGSPVDQINIGALDALSARAGCLRDKDGRPTGSLSAAARPFANMSLMRIAEASLAARGVRTGDLDPDETASRFLQLGLEGQTQHTLKRRAIMGGGGISASADGSYNAPGLFPNLLSALAGKMMDEAVESAEATFRQWCAPLASVADFKPKTIIAMGASGELPRVIDGDDFTQSTVAEEASWIAAEPFGDEFKLTPRMILDDDLSGFAELAADKQTAHELTLNRLCVDLLTGNVLTPDGNAFFSSAHGNDVASGAAISVAQLGPMRQKMRSQLAPGGKRRLRIGPAFVLVPTTLETAANQVLAPLTMVPVTDSTTNEFRNRLVPIVEPMLDDASTTIWYAGADPKKVRTVVYVFQRGFENGKVRTYYNPKNNCQVFQIEGRFASAVRNWRGFVRNNGA